jgi:menaquinone-dependent protoporphyrinogen IX oxidase
LEGQRGQGESPTVWSEEQKRHIPKKEASGREDEVGIVGSSLANWKRNSQAEEALKKFQKEFEHKALALFVSSVIPIAKREGSTEEIDKLRKIALEDNVSKYGLQPILTGLFEGVLDYNKRGCLTRKAMEVAFKSRLQNTGFQEAAPGVYDLRDWDEIRSWTRELAKKGQE